MTWSLEDRKRNARLNLGDVPPGVSSEARLNMLYLLAQIFVLLVLAVILGAGCAYLYFRRGFEDVTEQFESFQSVGALRTLVEQGQDRLEPIEKRLGRMEDTLRSLTFPIPPEASPSRDQLNEIQVLLRRQQDLLSRTAGRTEIAAALSPVEARLEDVDQHLSPLEKRLARIEQRMEAWRVASEAPDLSGVEARLEHLEQRLSTLPGPQGSELSSEARDRLRALETAFGGLAGRIEALDAPPVAPAAEAFQAERRDDGSRNLLKRPAFGRPDDLKKISGVGPVLESMLHGLGVYYFWQIADWTGEDVRFVDAKLTSFKGRIERDRWVGQAEAFSLEPQSSLRPNPASARNQEADMAVTGLDRHESSSLDP
ncbi:MAG: hypothetical protein AAFU79_06245 [Myxococcota bacterium]